MSTLWLDSMSTALTRERARVVRFRARLGVPRHAACTRGRNRATRARLRLSAVGRRARRGLDGWQWVWLLITADQTLNVRPRRYRDTQRPHATRHAVLEQPFRRSNSSRPPANAAVGGGGEARQHAISGRAHRAMVRARPAVPSHAASTRGRERRARTLLRWRRHARS